jgi:glycosyltransferase involved in cell wall biosynthesis
MTLFIYPNFSTFVKNDFEILKKYTPISQFKYTQSKSLLRHMLSQLQLLIWLLAKISKGKICYCWFADYHSFLPCLLSKLFKKKFYVVLGGYDVIYLPSIGYGSLKNPLRKFCALFTIRFCTFNLAVSNYVKEEALKLVPTAQIHVIYNGINQKPFLLPSKIKKENIILTVGSGNTEQRIKLKGIDFFLQLARELPEYDFFIVGLEKSATEYLSNIPQNLKITGWLNDHELVAYYRKAKIYCQFSLVESFGMAIVEAMLSECIPIVTNFGAMPEIVRSNGFVVKKDIEEVKKIITIAMESTGNLGEIAKENTLNLYSVERREDQIKQLLGL